MLAVDGWGRGIVSGGRWHRWPALPAPRWRRQPPQLPEIVVNAPSPIVRARPRPAAPARTVTPPAPEAPDTPAAAPAEAASGLAPHRCRPVRHRDRGHPRGDPAQRRLDAGRSPVRQARHHRFELRAWRVEPSDRARPRQLSRVRIQENGIGSSGVSDFAEDHAVPLDPLCRRTGRGGARPGDACAGARRRSAVWSTRPTTGYPRRCPARRRRRRAATACR